MTKILNSLWQNSKTKIVTKVKNLNCDKSQKLKLWKLKTSICDKNQIEEKNQKLIVTTQKLKLWPNSKTQMVTMLKTQIVGKKDDSLCIFQIFGFKWILLINWICMKNNNLFGVVRASTSCSAQQTTELLNKQIFSFSVPAAALFIWKVHTMK